MSDLLENVVAIVTVIVLVLVFFGSICTNIFCLVTSSGDMQMFQMNLLLSCVSGGILTTWIVQ